jgi:hypothetical protein
VPVRVLGESRIDPEWDDAEIGGRELPLLWMPQGIAPGLQLLEVRELTDVHLPGEVPADRLLERLAGVEVSAREGPVARERLLCALPEEHLQLAGAYLEDNGKSCVEWSDRLGHSFRLSV